MKIKYLVILCIILIFLSGCSKESNVIKKVKTVNIDNLSLSDDVISSDYVTFDSLESYLDTFTLDKNIIFKGEKIGLSKQVTLEKGGQVFYYYLETKIKVIEAFYGDVNCGDIIILKEFAGVQNNNKLVCDPETPPINSDKQYLFMLYKSEDLSSDNKPMYSYVSMCYSIHSLDNETNDLINKPNGYLEIHNEAINKFIENKDTKLNVKEEVHKIISKKIKKLESESNMCASEMNDVLVDDEELPF